MHCHQRYIYMEPSLQMLRGHHTSILKPIITIAYHLLKDRTQLFSYFLIECYLSLCKFKMCGHHVRVSVSLTKLDNNLFEQ